MQLFYTYTSPPAIWFYMKIFVINYLYVDISSDFCAPSSLRTVYKFIEPVLATKY